MACCFDTVVFLAVLHKTLIGIRAYTKRGGQTMMGLIGAHSLVYFGYGCLYARSSQRLRLP